MGSLQTIPSTEKDPFRIATAIRQLIEKVNGILGGWVAFPATQNPSSDPNVLDDYEEGTWTPVFTFATPGDLSVGYSAQVGTYTKIGRMVVLQFDVNFSSFTHSTASGDARVTGLPFAAAATPAAQRGGCRWNGITKAGYTDITTAILASTTTMVFAAAGSGVAAVTIAAADMPSGGTPRLAGYVLYFV